MHSPTRVVARALSVAAALAAAAVALSVLAPAPWAAVPPVVRAPQQVLDTAGVDALLAPLAGALAWLVWCWGAVGVLLTALGRLPGLPGRAAGRLAVVLLPAGARRAAALVLGVSLGVAAPVAAAPVPAGSAGGWVTAAAAADLAGSLGPATPGSAAGAPAAGAPATGRTAPGAAPGAAPSTAPGPVPDWPTAGAHVVVPGDCLWLIAADRLRAGDGRPAPDAAVARAVDAWWTANEAVVGPDPDLIRPGQVLVPPT